MHRGVRNLVENHRKIAVHFRRRRTAVVVGMLDVGGTYLQPALGELHRVFQFGCPGNGAAPDGTHGPTHLQASVPAFADGTFTLLPVFGQGQAGVGKMVLLFGRNHHQAAIRPDALLRQRNGPVHPRFPDGHGGDGDVVHVDSPFFAPALESVTAQVRQDLFRIAELGHKVRVAQVGHLDVAATGKYHLFGVEDLGPGGDELFQMLETVPDGDVAQGHFFGHARKDFPIIVFGHDASFLILLTDSLFSFSAPCKPVCASPGKQPAPPGGLRWGYIPSRRWIRSPDPWTDPSPCHS